MSEAFQGGSAATPEPPLWRIWVDTGGTFTDCVAHGPQGEARRAKVLSSGRVRAAVGALEENGRVLLEVAWTRPPGFFQGCRLSRVGRPDPHWTIRRSSGASLELDPGDGDWTELHAGDAVEIASGLEAPLLAAHWVTDTPLHDDLPAASLRLATTRGTNALLERQGARTALFITSGFRDLLAIGDQQRPELFAVDVVLRQPLYEWVVEVDERLDSRGGVLRPIDLAGLRENARGLLDRGVRTAAVALLHSYLDPAHEDRVAEVLLDLGFDHVSCSARLAPRIKIVPRAETAVVNAYLSAAVGSFLDTVGRAIAPGPVHMMTSAGGLVRDAEYLPKDSLLSGPAGGVVGAAAAAETSGWSRSLAFDMGGTSTDVSRFDGELDYRFETVIDDVRLLSPALAIETVAAGGGSICHFDGRQLKVGPQSAGADPGPACYGAGGPLTLTDVNLLLGRLRPESFEIPISRAAAEAALEELLTSLERAALESRAEEILQGLLEIANERMAEAIRRISIRQGYLPAEFALVAFGGAGGQHACALAEMLDIRTVLVPADAGLLSAVGLGDAQVERLAERQVLRLLKEVEGELQEMFGALEQQATTAVRAEGVPSTDRLEVRRLAFLRLQGQEASLATRVTEDLSLAERFGEVYRDHYGYEPEDAAIEVEALRVIVTSTGRSGRSRTSSPLARDAQALGSQQAWVGGRWQPVATYLRPRLRPGDRFAGPALIFENHCATLLHPDWHGRLDRHACLVLERQESPEGLWR